MASGPVGKGTTVDLMCGTGGFLIEAALSGRSVIGIDLDVMMVEGTTQNLEWALASEGKEMHKAVVLKGDATALAGVLPENADQVTGFVLDPPYGRNSQGSLAPVSLLEKVLLSAKSIASEQAGLVLILPIHPFGERPDEGLSDHEEVALLHGKWPEVVAALNNAEWAIQGRWVEHVHASLSRLILHATVAPRD
jgi:tRNA (guanine10-N2)-dimethyltransferase